MAIEFKIPDLGENVQSGDVVGVLVSVGDAIKENDPVLELETDKATIEVPSNVSGTITKIHISAGDKVAVGQVILTLDAAAGTDESPAEPAAQPQPEAPPEPPPAAEPEPAAAAETPPPAPAEPKVVEFHLPDLGENIESGSVVGVLVSAGDTVAQGQGVLELETDKATIEVPSEVSGVVKSVHITEGGTVSVGQLVLVIETSGKPVAAPKPAPKPEISAPTPESAAPKAAEPVSAPAPAAPAVSSQTATEVLSKLSYQTIGLPVRSDRTMIPAAPNVRRIARELGVDIAEVSGTSAGGRVSMDDVKRHAYRLLRALRAGLPLDGGGARPSQPLPDFSKWGQVDPQPMSNIRKATARQMDVAWSNIPHVTQFDKADITDLEALRQKFGQKVESAGAKLTVTAILLKVVASALKEFPQFNASLDMDKEEIIYKKYYHIGVAVDTDRGLLVPVIRDVDRKNIIELAVELNAVAEKARERKLKLEDMQGGTFTITNLGGIGGTNFTPIVNTPEVAILGVARGGMEPVFNKKSGQFEPRQMLPLALSYDHRIIDGADGARFTRYIVQYLEQPFLTALQGW